MRRTPCGRRLKTPRHDSAPLAGSSGEGRMTNAPRGIAEELIWAKPTGFARPPGPVDASRHRVDSAHCDPGVAGPAAATSTGRSGQIEVRPQTQAGGPGGGGV